MVVGIGKYEHITPVLRDTLHWLPVTARIQFKIAALTFDCVRGTGPVIVYLKQVVSRANTSIGQRSFCIAAPVVWNALPPDLRSPYNSRRQFRSKLKTYLFRQLEKSLHCMIPLRTLLTGLPWIWISMDKYMDISMDIMLAHLVIKLTSTLYVLSLTL